MNIANIVTEWLAEEGYKELNLIWKSHVATPKTWTYLKEAIPGLTHQFSSIIELWNDKTSHLVLVIDPFTEPWRRKQPTPQFQEMPVIIVGYQATYGMRDSFGDWMLEETTQSVKIHEPHAFEHLKRYINKL